MENSKNIGMSEISNEESLEVNGGNPIGVLIAIGGVYTGLFAIGFAAGVIYGLVEKATE
ncbi:MAG: hypothetical protein AB1777_11255 [Bacteroidota bacterium]|jgi:hypothetical protein